MELQTWRALDLPQTLKDHSAQVVHVLGSVAVLDSPDGEVDLLVEAVTLEERVVLGDIVVYLNAKGSSSLEGPATGHVLDRVAAATDKQSWNSEA